VVPDEALLHAAFGAPERARTAWREWSSGRDLDQADDATRRLFPAVYRNLRAAGVPDADVPAAVKQMARSLWIRTELLLRDAAATMAFLHARGVDAVLLKGAALVAGGYHDAGARPMSDFDLLVRPHEALTAAALLEEHGWTPASPLDPKAVAYRHAALLRKPERGCDLHWRVLWESDDPDADECFLQSAEDATLHGTPVKVLRPEHQLLIAIVHGTRRFETAVRWIGDALAILRARGAGFDWDLFAREVRARGWEFPVAEALVYLADTFEAEIPRAVIGELTPKRVTRRQRRIYAVRLQRPGDQTWEAVVAIAILSLRRRPRQRSRLTHLMWFPRSLQYAMGLPRLAGVPLAIAQRVLKRLTGSRSE
jgi:hypothetical protein